MTLPAAQPAHQPPARSPGPTPVAGCIAGWSTVFGHPVFRSMLRDFCRGFAWKYPFPSASARQLPGRKPLAYLLSPPLGALVVAAAGCGFQLQGAATLPDVMATTYVEAPRRFTEFHARLTDMLAARGIDLAESREEADAVLRILEDTSGQRVLSVSARNTPQEYEVFYAVGFSLQAGGAALIDDEFLVATRSYSYDSTQVLGMSAEEQVLREALAEELARRVLRRIEGVSPAGASALVSQ